MSASAHRVFPRVHVPDTLSRFDTAIQVLGHSADYPRCMREIVRTLLALPDGRALSSARFRGRNATKAGLATSKTKATAIPITTISDSFAEAHFRGVLFF